MPILEDFHLLFFGGGNGKENLTAVIFLRLYVIGNISDATPILLLLKFLTHRNMLSFSQSILRSFRATKGKKIKSHVYRQVFPTGNENLNL